MPNADKQKVTYTSIGIINTHFNTIEEMPIQAITA